MTTEERAFLAINKMMCTENLCSFPPRPADHRVVDGVCICVRAVASAIRDAENAKINQVLHLVAQREIAKDIGATVLGTHCEAIAKLKSKGT